MKDLTIDEAKRKIEELQRHIAAKEAEKPKGVTLYKSDGSILVKTDKETIKEAVGVNKANLREANLRGADLWGANLWGARINRIQLEQLVTALGVIVKD